MDKSEVKSELSNEELEAAKKAKREYQRKWRAAHKEETHAYMRNWRATHKDNLRAYKLRYWAKVAKHTETHDAQRDSSSCSNDEKTKKH